MEVSGQHHTPATLSQGKVPPDTHWIGGWVGLPRHGGEEKNFQPPARK